MRQYMKKSAKIREGGAAATTGDRRYRFMQTFVFLSDLQLVGCSTFDVGCSKF